MVQSFCINNDALYTVEGNFKNKTEVLKAVAAYRKESFAKVKAKFKNVKPGYLLQDKNLLWVYEADGKRLPKGARACVIVRR